jgi:ABC-type Fe3+-siderophore transport system, permease component
MTVTEKRKGARTPIAIFALIVAAFFVIMLDLSWAPDPLSFRETWDALIGRGTWGNTIIVRNFNLPRVVMGLIVGAGLAVSGAVMQALFRNPMASPYILGLSSGASLGAAIAILFTIPFIPVMVVTPVLAFVFCFMTMMIVYSLARVGGKTQTETLLLAGIAISSFLSALVSFLTAISGEKLEEIVFWSMGSLSRAEPENIALILPIVAVGVLIMIVLSKELNAMMLGDSHAMDLGVDVKKVRLVLLICATLVTAAAVSYVGVIGFVGLVIPHITRLIVGPDNRKVIPLSILGGAIYLVACDYIAHMFVMVAGVGVLPIGIITALIGGPYFIYLLRRRKHQVGWN